MLSLKEISTFYPPNLQHFGKFMLREYLQYKILELIFEHPYATRLAFIGGTCLRIVHQNQRFSEDLDFDNFDLSIDEFEKLVHDVGKGLEKEGYEIELRKVIKGAFHCYIRFPGLLYKEGLSGQVGEKILIKVDTFAQGFQFVPDRVILNRFDVFTTILTAPPSLLLAQKFYAISNRKRRKGRDFSDVVFLLEKAQPDYRYLEQKMGIQTSVELLANMKKVCSQLDMDDLAKDVQPFLFSPKDAKKVTHFLPYLEQELRK